MRSILLLRHCARTDGRRRSMLSYTSTRLLRTPCPRLAHHRYPQIPTTSANLNLFFQARSQVHPAQIHLASSLRRPFTSGTSSILLQTRLQTGHAHVLSPFRRQFSSDSSRLFPRVVRRTGDEEAGEEGLARSQPTSTEVPSFREELIKEDPSLRVEKFEELVGRPGIWVR